MLIFIVLFELLELLDFLYELLSLQIILVLRIRSMGKVSGILPFLEYSPIFHLSLVLSGSVF